MIKVNRPYPVPQISFTVGVGGVKKGQLATVSSSTAVAASEGVSTAIVIGVALDDYDAGDVGYFECLDGSILEMDIYQGGATDTFSASDIGKAFDIYVDGTSGEMFIDPNDTTGAMVVVMSYNNTFLKGYAKILKSLVYLA